MKTLIVTICELNFKNFPVSESTIFDIHNTYFIITYNGKNHAYVNANNNIWVSSCITLVFLTPTLTFGCRELSLGYSWGRSGRWEHCALNNVCWTAVAIPVLSQQTEYPQIWQWSPQGWQHYNIIDSYYCNYQFCLY